MTDNLRVTMIQADLEWEDAAENRRRLAAHFRGLVGHTDLIVLPEMFATGFSMDAERLAEPMDGPTVEWMREEAAALGCAITGSLIVRDGAHHFNRLLWATPDGGLSSITTSATSSAWRASMSTTPRAHAVSSSSSRAGASARWSATTCAFPVWSRNRDDYDVLALRRELAARVAPPAGPCCGHAPSRTCATSSA